MEWHIRLGVALLASAVATSCSQERSPAKAVDTTIDSATATSQEAASASVAGTDQAEPPAEVEVGIFGLSSHQSYAELDFGKYRTEAHTGPTVLPDFSGPQLDYAVYRTRLSESARAGVSFAGHYALSQICCGMQCSFVNTIDLANGAIGDFPLGGEENLELELSYRPESALILARFLAYASGADEPNCHYKSYVWTGRSFDELTSAIVQGRCSA